MSWNLCQDNLPTSFHSLTQAYACDGEVLGDDPLSFIKTTHGEDGLYYVKCYHRPGKGVRRFLGRSRIKAEWQNLQFFAKLGIAIPPLVAYGEKRLGPYYRYGVLITKQCLDCQDLQTLHRAQHSQLSNPTWLATVMTQVADYTRRLHTHGFMHNDLKWRNILVNIHDGTVYFFDCPTGKVRYGWQRRRGIIKDLACLDKIAKYALSPRQRLHFYKMYYHIHHLTPWHKQQIRKILDFFKGRE